MLHTKKSIFFCLVLAVILMALFSLFLSLQRHTVSLADSVDTIYPKQTPIVSPSQQSMPYDPQRQLKDFSLINGSDDGSFAWQEESIIPTCDLTEYVATFTPVGATEPSYTFLVPLYTVKTEPTQISFPQGTYMIEYAPTLRLRDVTFSGGTGDGSFAWENENEYLKSVGTYTKIIKFIPNDEVNYNYIGKTLTNSVTVNVTKALGSCTFPSVINFTYEANKTLQDFAVGGIGHGHFFWSNPTTPITTELNSAQANFVPDSNYYFQDVTFTKTINLVVAKAQPAPITFPTALQTPYDHRQKLRDITLNGGVGDGIFAWTHPDTIPTVSVSNYSVTFIPNDTLNYDYSAVSLSAGVNLIITQTIPQLIFPTTNPVVYSPSRAISEISLIGGVGDGSFAWTYPSTIPGVENEYYSATFTPNDTINYNYSSLVLTKNVELIVNKATPPGVVFPTANAITYSPSRTLSSIPLLGGSDNGTFVWSEPSTIPVVSLTQYLVTFNPGDVANYDYTAVVLTKKIELIVSPAPPPTITPPSVDSLTYNPNQTLSMVPFLGGIGDGVFEWSDPSLIPTIAVTQYLVTFIPRDSENYAYAPEQLLYVLQLQLIPLLATIDDLVFPTTETVEYNQSLLLSDLLFVGGNTDGIFNWVDPNINPMVGNSYLAEFIPATDSNYSYAITRTRFVLPSIEKGMPPCTLPEPISTVYGETLSSVELPTVFKWKDESTVISVVGNHEYTAIFTHEDVKNYRPIEVKIPLLIQKAELVVELRELSLAITRKTSRAITFDVKQGVEYSRDGIVWQDSPKFSNLVARTDYVFYIRYKETQTHLPSNQTTITITTPMSGFLAAGIVLGCLIAAAIAFLVLIYLPFIKYQIHRKIINNLAS
ncbi:MAG: hypothetical protein LBU04_02345 [Christensenellaceae bacterium]|jgi:hypothetical protein|nr:hypothetical protein [Christensenellaceae bacterium]